MRRGAELRTRRGIALVLALVLAKPFVVDQARGWWTARWLRRDSRATLGVVTSVAWTGHNVINYEYRAGGATYTGSDRKSLQDGRYPNVGQGEHTIVHFSASHPWLSAIDVPATPVPAGLPLLVLIWLLIGLLILTAVAPRHRLALRIP